MQQQQKQTKKELDYVSMAPDKRITSANFPCIGGRWVNLIKAANWNKSFWLGYKEGSKLHFF